MKKLNTRGFSHDFIIMAFVLIFAIAGVGYIVASHASVANPHNCSIWSGKVNPPTYNTRGGINEYYNSAIRDHYYLFTRDDAHMATIGYCFVAVQGYAYTNQTAWSVPLYEYWSASLQKHFYTTARYGTEPLSGGNPSHYVYERVVAYTFPVNVSGLKPFYRALNPQTSGHYYTTNGSSLLNALKAGYKYEGIQTYLWSGPGSVAPTPTPPKPPTTTPPPVVRGTPAPTCNVTISPGANVQNVFNSLHNGETLCLHSGTYGNSATTTWLTNNSGAAGSPLTLTTVPGESRAVIEGNLTIGRGGGGVNNITVSHLVLKQDLTDNSRVNASQGCTATRVLGTVITGNNITFEYNDVSEASVAPQYRDTALGVSFDGRSSNVIVRYNAIHDFGACDHYDHGIYFDHVDNGQIYGNWIWNGGCGYGVGGNPGRGCGAGIQLWTDPSHTSIHGNVVDGTGIGMYLAGTSNSVYHNIFYNLRGMVSPSGSVEGATAYNGYGGSSSNNFYSNDYFNAGSLCASCTASSSSGSTTADPQFVNAAIHNYTLKASSPVQGYNGL